VVGAGISGLVAARVLVDAGREVIVLDKARGVGGRMATRRIGDAVVDHGAQFFTTHDQRFQRMVEAWMSDGVAREWARGLTFPFNGQVNGSPAFRGDRGMTSVPKRLAERLDVRLESRVLGIDRAPRGYVVHTEAGDLPRAEILLLTAPVPQSLAMLAAGDVRIAAEDKRTLTSISYDPFLTVLAVLDGPSRVPTPGALRLDDEPIAFIADNRQKGISPEGTSVTIHAGVEFSRRRLEDDPDEVGKELLAAAEEWLGSKVVTFAVHRWRYGHPVIQHPEPFQKLSTEPILFAGDAFGGPTVEGAALSGQAAGEHIRRMF
jgi:predicted NAD/FAD-dependent oxidoreductase